MDRRFISVVLAALVAGGALAVGARQWQKSKRNGLAEANGSPAAPTRKAESANPAVMVQAPATTAATPGSAGATTPQAAGLSSSPNGTSPAGGSPIEETQSAGEKPGWKTYTSAENGFAIQYAANWTFIGYENSKGKQPSDKPAPANAAETRNLFSLQMDGPKQDREGGGDFSDGVIVTVKVSGTNGASTLEKWLEDQATTFSPDNLLEHVSIGTNGFKGTIVVGHYHSTPEKTYGEEGSVYRILPSRRAVLITWYRLNMDDDKANDFSYQNYLQPMLASFRLLSPTATN